MSLELSKSSPRVTVKTHGAIPEVIHMRGKGIDVDIPLSDFLCAAWYVLTNTDLYPNDPRNEFMRVMKKVTYIKGYDAKNQRLGIDEDSDSLSFPQINE